MIDFTTLPVTKRTFTVDEYYRMAEAGILTPDDRVELIYGEIITLSPVGSQHAACVMRLNALFSQLFTDKKAIVSIQNPVRVDWLSEPEPDVALLQYREDFYANGHPTPKDTLLLVEVSDTTQAYDQKVKVPLYAKAGIPEVWIVNLPKLQVEVYTQPDQGAYQRVVSHSEADIISLTTIDCSIAVRNVVGTANT